MLDVSSALHIIEGASAAETLRQTFNLPKSHVITHGDPLNQGPCPRLGLVAWRELRSEYWRRWLESDDWVDWNPTALTDSLERIATEKVVALWLGVTTAEQLLLAWLLHELRRGGHDCRNLLILQFPPSPDVAAVSAGWMAPPQFERLVPTGYGLTLEQQAEAADVWWRYSDSHPAALVEYVEGEIALPLLRDAMRAIIRRYPDHETGLGFWDERLLRNIDEHGARGVAYAIGHSIAAEDTIDMIGDLTMFDRIIEMSEAERPLVEIDGNIDEGMRACKATLTDEARAVLAGKKNAAELNGIDEWIGGVHLTAENIIFRSGKNLLI